MVQARQPEFNPWDPHGERREPVLHMCAMAFACPHICIINKYNLKSTEDWGYISSVWHLPSSCETLGPRKTKDQSQKFESHCLHYHLAFYSSLLF